MMSISYYAQGYLMKTPSNNILPIIYIHYCQAHIFHLQTEAEDMIRQTAELDDLWDKAPQLAHGFPQIDSYSVESVVNTMQHFIDQWQLKLDWAKRLREREVALVTQAGTEMSARN